VVVLPWVGFIAFVLVMLALDLGVFNRNPHVVSIRESLLWTAVWIALALVFNVVIYYAYEGHWFGIGERVGLDLGGREAALQFLTGYVIEKSLSIDNIFVIALIFSYFKVPRQFQHRTLFWGIVGALLMRGAMIAAGSAMIKRFSWSIYLFGGLLIYTAIKMMVTDTEKLDPEKSVLIRVARRLYPVSDRFDEDRFFTVENGRRVMTRLFIVLLAVEGADVMFAVDSIPAVFAVTQDAFIVFTSNIFAILGLRSLYFSLSAALHKFRYLQASLVFMLAFIGIKMMLSHHYHIPVWVSLTVIAGMLSVGIGASIYDARKSAARERRMAREGAAPVPARDPDRPRSEVMKAVASRFGDED
jgi:tellurite resistance protein TerC